jgi:type II secretory pathway component GspD/PulD (secretin)
MRVSFDQSIPSRNVVFRLNNVNFATAMEVAALMTHTFSVPMSPSEVMVAADNEQKRRELEHTLEKTFYFPDATTPQEVNDLANVLRTVLGIRTVTQVPGMSAFTVRAPQQTVHAAELLLSSMSSSRPQVMLEIQAFEVNSTMLRTVGVDLPLQFQMFNIPAAALALLNSPNIQNIIAQLIASGGLNAADTGSIAALIAQFQNQQSSLLANPVATFGGGLTLFGVGIPPLTANLSMNESLVRSIEQASVQASQGNPAEIHVGTRYPVLTQSFSPGFTLPGVNFNVVGAIPGFTYVDLGLTLKAKPQVHGNSAVTLDMEMAIKSLGAQSFNGVPTINNREYKGMITVKNGEPAVVAGILSDSEQHTLRGIPGISHVPILERLASTDVKNDARTELIVIVTPHIMRPKPTNAPLIAVP